MGNLGFNLLIFPGFLFVATLGFLWMGIERKLTARFQWRMGPPLWQPYIDFLKLMIKETLIPANAQRFMFITPPLLAFAGVLISSLILFRTSLFPKTSFLGDVVVFLYFLLFPSLALILGGSASGNPLAAMGVSREIKLMLSYELPLILAVFVPVWKAGSVKFAQIMSIQLQKGAFALHYPSCFLAFIVALLSIQAKIAFPPYDIPEGETEIMGGPLIEYSGSLLGMFYLTRGILHFLLPSFLVFLFWGGFLFNGWQWILSFLKTLGVFVIMVVIKNVNPRIRIDQAVRFFWSRVFVLGIIAMGLAIAGW